ncbi:MAG: hypothetical protein GEU91_19170 [Rhizobiales bacterium]|nr:hypothetical protein [Hyphomicrobiales bacterium]
MRSTASDRHPPARTPIGQAVRVLAIAVGASLWLVPAVTAGCAQGTTGSGTVAPKRVSPDQPKPTPLTAEQSEDLLRRKQERQERMADEAQRQLKEKEGVR